MDSTLIFTKLKKFLFDHQRFERECEIVYLMVAIRKILDCYNDKSFPTIRFYCNWVVHDKLDRPATTSFLANKFSIEEEPKMTGHEIARMLKNGTENFITLKDLKEEIEKFSIKYTLQFGNLFKYWSQFMKLILNSITDCPVIFTSDTIKSMGCERRNNTTYAYKFELFTHSRIKPILKLKLKLYPDPRA